MKEKTIIRFFEGFSTEREEKEIFHWISLSQKNKDKFYRLRAQYLTSTFEETTTELDIDDSFKEFKNLIKSNHRKKRSLLYSTLKYAAVLLIAISTSYLIYIASDSETPSNIPISDQVVTLESYGGSVKVIDSSVQSDVIDKNGDVVGLQTGNRIVYKKVGIKKKSYEYHTLKVPYAKRFDVVLSDGTKITLNSGSILKYPTNFIDGKVRQVYLNGEAYFDVAENKVHPFVVNTDVMNVRVLGTEFNLSSYPEDVFSDVVLVEGSVSVYDSKNEYDKAEKTILEPGFKASFDKTNKAIIKTEVLTNIYTSWRNGELVFRNMTFDNILKKLERHYNVTIINNNKELSGKVFNASFGQISIEKVFENLKKYRGINYTIKGKEITIQ